MTADLSNLPFAPVPATAPAPVPASRAESASGSGSVASTPGAPPATVALFGQVDSHFHVFNRGVSVPGARYTPAYAAELGAWQTQAQAVGVTHGVLVQTSFMGTDNRLLLAQLMAHRQTLRGVAVVAPDAPGHLLANMHARGVRGIRLNLAGLAHDLSAWRHASNVWDTLLQLGWHVELHTDNGRLPDVLPALPRELPLVLDHFARPLTAALYDPTVTAVRTRRQNGGAAVYIKLSAPYRLAVGVGPIELGKLWQGELGPYALLWGSDWPFTNHESVNTYPQLHVALADWLGTHPDIAHHVRSVNAMRLYGFTTA